jgi:hypothetical protein
MSIAARLQYAGNRIMGLFRGDRPGNQFPLSSKDLEEIVAGPGGCPRNREGATNLRSSTPPDTASSGYPPLTEEAKRLADEIYHGLINRSPITQEPSNRITVHDAHGFERPRIELPDGRIVPYEPGEKSLIYETISGRLVVGEPMPGVLFRLETVNHLYVGPEHKLLVDPINYKAVYIRNTPDGLEGLFGLQRQLKALRELQQQSEVLPKSEEYDMAFLNVPYDTISGDLLVMKKHRDGRIVFTIGDVKGHGIQSYPTHRFAQGVLQTRYGPSGEIPPKQVNAILHAQMAESTINDFMTGLSVSINRNNMEYSNAGHPMFLLYRAADNSFETPEDTRGSPFGMLSGPQQYTAKKITFQPGDIAVFYTDGATDIIMDGDRRDMKAALGAMQSAIRANRDKPAASINDALYRLVRTLGKPDDDISFLTLKYCPENT